MWQPCHWASGSWRFERSQLLHCQGSSLDCLALEDKHTTFLRNVWSHSTKDAASLAARLESAPSKLHINRSWSLKLVICSAELCISIWRCVAVGGMAPRVLSFDTGWRWVDRVTPWPLFHQKWAPCKAGWVHGRSGEFGEDKQIVAALGVASRCDGRPVHSLMAMRTEL